MILAVSPRRGDGGRRDELWRYVSARWAVQHPDIALVESHDPGPAAFNRSAAINRGLDRPWDVAVVVDADSFTPAANVEAAVQACLLDPGRVWFPHDRFRYLSDDTTVALLAGVPLSTGDLLAGTEWTLEGTCSSALVVHRTLWDAVGGFDAGFVGWGFEDVAFHLATNTVGAPSGRIQGDVFHLHHPPSAENDEASPLWQAGRRRMLRYEQAASSPAAMRALLDEINGRQAA